MASTSEATARRESDDEQQTNYSHGPTNTYISGSNEGTVVSIAVEASRGTIDPDDWTMSSSDRIVEQRRVVRNGLARHEEELRAERQELLEKQYRGAGLEDSELRRLKYVRWQLDAIDDAKHGYALDQLEAMVQAHEKLGDRVERAIKSLEGVTKGGKKRRR